MMSVAVAFQMNGLGSSFQWLVQSWIAASRSATLVKVPRRPRSTTRSMHPQVRHKSRIPSYQTVWWRFGRWAKDGTLGRVLTALQGQAQASGEVKWVVSVDSTIGRGWRSRPDGVVADKAYSHPSTRDALRRTGIRAVIPQRSDQIGYRASRGRNVVERALCRLKNWRVIATRYDKHARNYRAGLVLAAIVLFWL